MKTIKIKEPVLIPADGHGQAKHTKKGQVIEVSDAFAASLIGRKLAEEVKPGKPEKEAK